MQHDLGALTKENQYLRSTYLQGRVPLPVKLTAFGNAAASFDLGGKMV